MFVSSARLSQALYHRRRQRTGQGRGYVKDDAAILLGIATTAAPALAFYTPAAEVKTLYREPSILWLFVFTFLLSNRI